jgi:site-specific DNA-cytosine methylase
MKVLSLFDGISAGQLALQRAGIAVDAYYASEVDKYAISVTQKNFPNTIQLGDVTKWREWDIPWGEIDLVIGGSPCQGFSFAGKQLNFNDPRSALFFVFVDICHRVADDNPKMKFMLENVRMKKEYQDVISGYFGVEPIPINSSLVSAQNRYRLYWTNIPNVTQPEDKGILLRDIIQSGYVNEEKSATIKSQYYKSSQANFERSGTFHATGFIDPIDERMVTSDGKAFCLTARYQGAVAWNSIERRQKTMIAVPEPIITGAAQRGRYIVDGKRADHTVDSMSGLTEQRIELRKDGKSNCLTSVQKDSLVGIDNHSFRKLTPIECERLQTFPDNWTEGISYTQRYKALGNSWTVDVVAHIFKNL